MLFHGKALEIYTAAYQNIQNIDENEDLEVRVIKVCFSIYSLQKDSSHTSAVLRSHAQNAMLFFWFPELLIYTFLHFSNEHVGL